MRITEREQQVMGAVARGLCDKEIALELGVKPGTVRVHISRILHKLGVQSRVSVAVYELTGWLPSGAFARRLDFALGTLDSIGGL